MHGAFFEASVWPWHVKILNVLGLSVAGGITCKPYLHCSTRKNDYGLKLYKVPKSQESLKETKQQVLAVFFLMAVWQTWSEHYRCGEPFCCTGMVWKGNVGFCQYMCVCVSGVEAFEVLTSSQLVMFFERVICQRCVAILHIYICLYRYVLEKSLNLDIGEVIGDMIKILWLIPGKSEL